MSGSGRFSIACCLVLSLVTTACRDDPPQKEIQEAQGAIDAAASAGADDYAPTEIAAARDALKRAREAVDQRDYRLALNNALDGRERAQNAAKEATDSKAVARADAERAMTEANNALTDARSKLQSGEAKASPRVVIAVERVIADSEKEVQDARAAFDRGDFRAVATSLRGTTERLQSVERRLEGNLPSPRRRPPTGARGRI